MCDQLFMCNVRLQPLNLEDFHLTVHALGAWYWMQVSIKTAIVTAAACDSAKTAISCVAESRLFKGSTKQNTQLDDGKYDSRVQKVFYG